MNKRHSFKTAVKPDKTRKLYWEQVGKMKKQFEQCFTKREKEGLLNSWAHSKSINSTTLHKQ